MPERMLPDSQQLLKHQKQKDNKLSGKLLKPAVHNEQQAFYIG